MYLFLPDTPSVRRIQGLRKFYLAKTKEEREEFAASLHTTCAYIQQIYLGHAICSPELALAIVKATGGKVRRADLRPDLWGRQATAEARAA